MISHKKAQKAQKQNQVLKNQDRNFRLCALCAFLWLNFLREDRGLAPADRLRSRKSILMHDAKMSLRLIFHFAWRMALEPEQDLEADSNQSRMYRQVK